MPIVVSLSSAAGWSITLDDKDGVPVVLNASDNRIVTGVSGFIGIAPTRSVHRPRPTGHGGLNDTRWTDGQLMEVRGEVSGSTVEAALSELRAINKAALQTLDYAPALLKWTEGNSGLSLQRLVKIEGDLDAPVEGITEPLIAYQAQFFAEDPRAYSQTAQTVDSAALSTASGGMVYPKTYPYTFTPSSGGTVAVTNNGNRKTPPTFRIYGMCVNPAIVNLTTGERITLTGTIANGDYLELDVAARTCKLNGSTLQNQYVDSVNTTWFELDEGASNLQLISGSFDASAYLEVEFRDAYA